MEGDEICEGGKIGRMASQQGPRTELTLGGGSFVLTIGEPPAPAIEAGGTPEGKRVWGGLACAQGRSTELP